MTIDLHKPLMLRAGLPRVGKKLADGGDVTIAYLGGSITQGGGEEGGYRGLATAWMRATYSSATVTEINAGIGGTGSDLGVFRLHDDALSHRPDLLFVEFAVNDGSTDPMQVAATMEGIVRHTKREMPHCDICFVYTLAQGQLEQLRAGALPPMVQVHENVAAHYGVPSIHLMFDVLLKLDSEQMTWDEFSNDTCHPTAAGYAVYGQTMAAALGTALKAPDCDGKPLPTAMSDAPWDTCRLIALPRSTQAQPGWRWVPMKKTFGWENFEGVLESDTSGSELTMNLTGTMVGLYFRTGPETGHASWSIDGGDFEAIDMFDDFSQQFWRPQSRVLARGLERKEHQLRIRIDPGNDPRSKGTRTQVAYLMAD